MMSMSRTEWLKAKKHLPFVTACSCWACLLPLDGPDPVCFCWASLQTNTHTHRKYYHASIWVRGYKILLCLLALSFYIFFLTNGTLRSVYVCQSIPYLTLPISIVEMFSQTFSHNQLYWTCISTALFLGTDNATDSDPISNRRQIT